MASCMLRSDAAEDRNHWTFQLSEACHLVSVCFSRCKQINDPNMYLEILGGGTVAKHGKQYQGVQWCSSILAGLSCGKATRMPCENRSKVVQMLVTLCHFAPETTPLSGFVGDAAPRQNFRLYPSTNLDIRAQIREVHGNAVKPK